MNIEKFVMDIKYNLMRSNYWYASVLMQMPVVYDEPGVDTFAVGKKRAEDFQISLFISSAYVEKVVELCGNDRCKIIDHFTEILKHEVHHLVFGHLVLDLPDRRAEEIACELSANSYIDRKKLVSLEPDTPPGVFPEDFGFEPKQSALDYYGLLSKESEEKADGGSVNGGPGQGDPDQNGQGQGEQGQGDPGQNGSGQDGQGQGGQGPSGASGGGQGGSEKKHVLDSHEKWKGMENSQMEKIEIQALIRNANQALREAGVTYGNMPGDLQTVILACDEDEPPIIPWEIVLKNFLASASETMLDYTMRRPSKRYGTRPGTKKEDVLSIAIGIDTSGSISQEVIQIFFNELYWVEKTGSRMTVFEWDTKVRREYDFKDYDGTVKGGGGTDPTDFLETVSRRKFDCALIFTDLYFEPSGEDYRLPMLWIDVSDRDGREDFPVQGASLKVGESHDGVLLLRQ